MSHDETLIDPIEPDLHEGIRRFFEEQIPFNKLLGLRMEHLARGETVLVMPFKPELIGNPFVPALHGGSLSALADAAGGASVFSGLSVGDEVSTIDLRIDYLRPAAPVESRAEARVVRLGGRVGVSRIQVWQQTVQENRSSEAQGGTDGARVLVAEATGVYSVRRR
jgi:uncharacterized protein (TIGR00369 family)